MLRTVRSVRRAASANRRGAAFAGQGARVADRQLAPGGRAGREARRVGGGGRNYRWQGRRYRAAAVPPLGVLLPNGLGLNVDGVDMGRVAFVRCLPNGCIAEVELDDDLVTLLSESSSAIFVVFRTPEEGVGIPVSLEGFSEGFAALP